MKKFRMNLPEEILEQIFVKLCVKSVVRLKCVCKTWRDLIKTGYFGEKYYTANYSNENQILVRKFMGSFTDLHQVLLSLDPQTVSSHRMNLPEVFTKVRIVSCNGILCYGEGYESELCYLHNPTTEEQYVTLPPSCFQADEGCTNYIGFGFDSSSNDYKVVRVWELRGPERFAVRVAEVFRLSTDRWSEVCMEHGSRKVVDENGGVFVNGIFHWREVDSEDLLTFNFEDEKFGVMQAPPACPNSRHYKDLLAVLDGSLAFCSCILNNARTTYDHDIERMDVWIMRESWTKAYSVGLADYGFYRVVACWNFGTNLALIATGGQLVMVAGKDDNTGVMLPALDCRSVSRALLFRPSLISVRTGSSVF